MTKGTETWNNTHRAEKEYLDQLYENCQGELTQHKTTYGKVIQNRERADRNRKREEINRRRRDRVPTFSQPHPNSNAPKCRLESSFIPADLSKYCETIKQQSKNTR